MTDGTNLEAEDGIIQATFHSTNFLGDIGRLRYPLKGILILERPYLLHAALQLPIGMDQNERWRLDDGSQIRTCEIPLLNLSAHQELHQSTAQEVEGLNA